MLALINAMHRHVAFEASVCAHPTRLDEGSTLRQEDRRQGSQTENAVTVAPGHVLTCKRGTLRGCLTARPALGHACALRLYFGFRSKIGDMNSRHEFRYTNSRIIL